MKRKGNPRKSFTASSSSIHLSPPIKQDKKRIRRVSFSTKNPEVQVFEPAKSPTQFRRKSSLSKSVFDNTIDENVTMDFTDYVNDNNGMVYYEDQTMEFTSIINGNVSLIIDSANSKPQPSTSTSISSSNIIEPPPQSATTTTTNNSDINMLQKPTNNKPSINLLQFAPSQAKISSTPEEYDPTPAPAIPDASFLFGSYDDDDEEEDGGVNFSLMDRSISQPISNTNNSQINDSLLSVEETTVAAADTSNNGGAFASSLIPAATATTTSSSFLLGSSSIAVNKNNSLLMMMIPSNQTEITVPDYCSIFKNLSNSILVDEDQVDDNAKYTLSDFWSHLSIRFLTNTINDRKSIIPPPIGSSRRSVNLNLSNEELVSKYTQSIATNQSLSKVVLQTRKKIEAIEKEISEKEDSFKYNEPKIIRSVMTRQKNLDIQNNVRYSLQPAKTGANIEKLIVKSDLQNVQQDFLNKDILKLDDQIKCVDQYIQHYEYLIQNLQTEIAESQRKKKLMEKVQPPPPPQVVATNNSKPTTTTLNEKPSSSSNNEIKFRKRRSTQRFAKTVSAQDLLISHPNLLSLIKTKFMPFTVDRKHSTLLFSFPYESKGLNVDIKFHPKDFTINNINITPPSFILSKGYDEVENNLFKLIECHIVNVVKKYNHNAHLPIIVPTMSSLILFMNLFVKEIKILRSKSNSNRIINITKCKLIEDEKEEFESLSLQIKQTINSTGNNSVRQEVLDVSVACVDSSLLLTLSNGKQFHYDCNLLEQVNV